MQIFGLVVTIIGAARVAVWLMQMFEKMERM